MTKENDKETTKQTILLAVALTCIVLVNTMNAWYKYLLIPVGLGAIYLLMKLLLKGDKK